MDKVSQQRDSRIALIVAQDAKPPRRPNLTEGARLGVRAYFRHSRQKEACLEPEDEELLRSGWKIGAEDFRDWLADKLSRPGRKGGRAIGVRAY